MQSTVLDHGFDGRIIDALALRQPGRDGLEVAIACRWRQRHRSLAHNRELAVGQAQNAIGFSNPLKIRTNIAAIKRTFVALRRFRACTSRTRFRDLSCSGVPQTSNNIPQK